MFVAGFPVLSFSLKGKGVSLSELYETVAPAGPPKK
jgi:hypothetical protein